MLEPRSVHPHPNPVPYLRQHDRAAQNAHHLSSNLVSAVGLSAAYRAIWAKARPTPDALAALSAPMLSARLDDESNALLRLACDLSPYIADTPLARFLALDLLSALALLPLETRRALEEFGFLRLSANGDVVTALTDADETLSEYGLRYLPACALQSLVNRDVVDAGSYDGTSARFFLSHFPVRRVYCFEPDPDNYTALNQSTQGEQADHSLVATCCALSDRAGLARMAAAGVGSSRAKAEIDGAPSVLVKTQTLDMFLRPHGDARIGLIKLDVEGDALAALQGAAQTIQKHQPILIVSFYHTPDEFTATLPYLAETYPDYGFRVRKVTANLFKEHVIIGVPNKA